MTRFEAFLTEMRACRLCADKLPLGPNPIFRLSPTARLLMVGQAPGTRVHESGIPWNDRSGERLREWLQIDRETFYDVSRIAILPTGLCYPGVDKNGGDKPPIAICAPTWHPQALPHLGQVGLTLLIGSYAQAYYLGKSRSTSTQETVRRWRDYLPKFLPLPHPSWRNTAWLRRNPWFEIELLPELRRRVHAML
ncbi:MAG TPA: uracil-DNA glycosylase family protein [Alphaproteobacteria bacterium]|nr:uracil-DNA glycosylase family protein [Alphaproteobacteria bacterium]